MVLLRRTIPINLEKQVQIYSVDTGMFYNAIEKRIHNRLKRNYIFKKHLKLILKKQNEFVKTIKWNRYMDRTNERITKLKSKLKKELQGNTTCRTLDQDEVKPKHIISVFDSVLTRTLGISVNTLTEEIIIVQSYYFDVLKNLIMDGFYYKNQKYVVFTASAGQIRTKKTVFIKEDTFNRYKKNLMCGLTIDDINSGIEQGVNINKFLAYLALCNSATEAWNDFDIDRAIVVNDLETYVKAEVDYIDSSTYHITRQLMDIPINHTDGCGMILPKKNKKSFMVRMPWVKGLLVPFAFDRFAKENESKLVTDIYGKQYDIIQDKIEVILTKSQFKMWKYYSSWDEYKDYFKQYQCQAAKCNEEEDLFTDAKLNYQMLQTLNEMTDEELLELSQESIDNITKIGRDKNVMLKVLGATKMNKNKNYFQRALEMYPSLLADTYSKEVLKDVKKSLVKKARSGKLDIDGKYTFIIPDLYAFCERVFLNIENPTGILQNGEVFCTLYKDHAKLDCLRSPHLYREHAIRINTIATEKKKWFITKGLHTSTHDPISKILQNDFDGDKALITPSPTIVACAERHMKGIVPLYYEMAVAGKENINNQTIYNGLVSAYTGGNIGEISNDISKIWNSEQPNIDAVKWLCMINNFVIDYAKTLFKPVIPDEQQQIIKSFTKAKLPNFFVFAKDKEVEQVEPINNSLMNRLGKMIPNHRIVFSNQLKTFDYAMLLKNKEIAYDFEIIEKYHKLNQSKRYLEISSDSRHVYQEIKNQLLDLNGDPFYITDVLTKYLYVEKPASMKTTLWECFGDIIVGNMKDNLSIMTTCARCDKELKVLRSKKYCNECAADLRKAYKAEKEREYRKAKHGQKS